jgi:hypothetical protein
LRKLARSITNLTLIVTSTLSLTLRTLLYSVTINGRELSFALGLELESQDVSSLNMDYTDRWINLHYLQPPQNNLEHSPIKGLKDSTLYPENPHPKSISSSILLKGSKMIASSMSKSFMDRELGTS